MRRTRGRCKESVACATRKGCWADVADMKNVGIGRAAGTITAAAFLKNAIKDTPWVHLDIAGVAWTQGAATKEKSYNPKGATGFGVRLVLDYLQNLRN